MTTACRTHSITIAHVLSSFEPGGQERLAADLARFQHIDGHRVLAVSLAAGPEGSVSEAFRENGVAAHTVAKRWRVDPSLPVRLAAVLRRHRVEVVHTHNPHALIYGAPAARLAGAIVVHSKHGVNPATARRLRLRRTAAQLVDAFVAVTPALAAKAIETLDCDPSRLHVVFNGIDVARFAPTLARRREIREELGIPSDAWVVGTVGRLAPEKNQALLVGAMAPLLGPRRRLVIVGDGPERERLRARIDRMPGGRYVHFLGQRSDVESVLTALDAFALTSITEGLPLALLEAMATELPVVCTAVGGVPDVLDDGVTGLLVPVDDPDSLTARLASLAHNSALARRIGAAGRRLVLERHSLDRMARAYEDLYEGARDRWPACC